MMRSLRSASLAAAALVLLISRNHASAQPAREGRVFRNGSFITIGGVAPSVESFLLLPALLDADSEVVVVFDYGDASLKAISFGGKLLWARGRRGSGPGEFRNPTDIKIDWRQRVWLTDPPNLRAEVFDLTGARLGSIRLPPGTVRVQPLPDGRVLAILAGDDRFLAVLDSAGRLVRDLGSPDVLANVPILAREAHIAATKDGAVVVGFAYSDAWLLLPSAEPNSVAVRRGIENVPFAGVLQWKRNDALITRIDPNALVGSISLDVHGDTLFVLFGGEDKTVDVGRLLDTYSVRTGEYLASYMLPADVSRIAVTATGDIAGLTREPVPAITVWRWRPMPEG